jgi:hypothetical protein
MNKILVRSMWLYGRLLLLYPEELRREFGDEMALAFADDLQAAWGDARVAGVLQIWWYALRELLTVALPGQKSNPCVLVPALSFAFAASTLSAELWMAMHLGRREYPPLLGVVILVLMPSLLNAFVAFIVTRVHARSSIAALQLD